jgi:hypothetical protein
LVLAIGPWPGRRALIHCLLPYVRIVSGSLETARHRIRQEFCSNTNSGPNTRPWGAAIKGLQTLDRNQNQLQSRGAVGWIPEPGGTSGKGSRPRRLRHCSRREVRAAATGATSSKRKAIVGGGSGSGQIADTMLMDCILEYTRARCPSATICVQAPPASVSCTASRSPPMVQSPVSPKQLPSVMM